MPLEFCNDCHRYHERPFCSERGMPHALPEVPSHATSTVVGQQPPTVISEEARIATQDVANSLYAKLIDPASEVGREMLRQSHQLAIDKATEQLQAENQELKDAREKVLATAASFEHWAKERQELQADNASLEKANEALQRSNDELSNGLSASYHARDKIEQIVLGMRQIIESCQTLSLMRSEPYIPPHVRQDIELKLSYALSLTTPLANNYIKREEFEKVVGCLRAVRDSDFVWKEDLESALSRAETILKPQTTEARKEGDES